jgi:hypothetical protein
VNAPIGSAGTSPGTQAAATRTPATPATHATPATADPTDDATAAVGAAGSVATEDDPGAGPGGGGSPIVAIVALAAIVLGGLTFAWLMARRRASRDSRDSDPLQHDAASVAPMYPVFSSVGGAASGFEDPLVAAMGRASDRRSGGSSWKVVDPSLVSDGADGPLWVRRLDAKMPVLPATARGDRDLPTYDSGVDAELG